MKINAKSFEDLISHKKEFVDSKGKSIKVTAYNETLGKLGLLNLVGKLEGRNVTIKVTDSKGDPQHYLNIQSIWKKLEESIKNSSPDQKKNIKAELFDKGSITEERLNKFFKGDFALENIQMEELPSQHTESVNSKPKINPHDQLSNLVSSFSFGDLKKSFTYMKSIIQVPTNKNLFESEALSASKEKRFLDQIQSDPKKILDETNLPILSKDVLKKFYEGDELQNQIALREKMKDDFSFMKECLSAKVFESVDGMNNKHDELVHKHNELKGKLNFAENAANKSMLKDLESENLEQKINVLKSQFNESFKSLNTMLNDQQETKENDEKIATKTFRFLSSKKADEASEAKEKQQDAIGDLRKSIGEISTDLELRNLQIKERDSLRIKVPINDQSEAQYHITEERMNYFSRAINRIESPENSSDRA